MKKPRDDVKPKENGKFLEKNPKKIINKMKKFQRK